MSTWAIFQKVGEKFYYYSGTVGSSRIWRTDHNRAAVWTKKPECLKAHEALGVGKVVLLQFFKTT